MKIKLSIPQPCHEDWNKMTPTEKGKFCASCKKEVFDLTQSTEDEVADKMSKSKSGEVCARIPVDYLNKPIQLYAAGIGSYGKLSAAGALITAVAFTPMITGNSSGEESHSGKNHIFIKNPAAIRVNGTVTSEKNELVSGAKVVIIQNGHKATAFTRANGRFVFNLDPMKIKNGTALLRIEKEGFDFFERKISVSDNMQNGRFIVSETDKLTEITKAMAVVSGNMDVIQYEVKDQLLDEAVVNAQTTSIDHYYVLGGAVMHTIYKEEEILPVYAQDTIKEEKFVFEEAKIIPNEIFAYPNPATDIITIEMKYEGNYTLSVFDLTGKMVQQKSFSADKLILDLSEQERGTYIIKVADNTTSETFDSKVILMR